MNTGNVIVQVPVPDENHPVEGRQQILGLNMEWDQMKATSDQKKQDKNSVVWGRVLILYLYIFFWRFR